MSVLDGPILDDVKKALGIGEDYDVFDLDIAMAINTAFFSLQQLGVGPRIAYQLSDDYSDTWIQFFNDTDVPENYAAVKSYIVMKTKLMFDPPSVGHAVTAMNEMVKELEWRLNVQAEGSYND